MQHLEGLAVVLIEFGVVLVLGRHVLLQTHLVHVLVHKRHEVCRPRLPLVVRRRSSYSCFHSLAFGNGTRLWVDRSWLLVVAADQCWQLRVHLLRIVFCFDLFTAKLSLVCLTL